MLEREINQQTSYIYEVKAQLTQGFIPWFSSPQRLAYVHVIEVSTQG
jgi:hypothetical protein